MRFEGPVRNSVALAGANRGRTDAESAMARSRHRQSHSWAIKKNDNQDLTIIIITK
jgi:hypothetical protein